MIRKCTSEDISDVVALQKSVERESAIWGYGADSPKDWEQRNLAWTFLALEAGRPVGFIYCAPRPHSYECVFPAESKILEIIDLVVASDARCQRLGHALVAVVQAQAHAAGFTHLRVYSAAKRFDDIVRFYRDCGFTPWYLVMTKEITAELPDVGYHSQTRRT
jgi:GNAT superfamily N-acetyltransferase